MKENYSPKLSPRDLANKITKPVTARLHERFPKLLPNHVTLLGLVGTSMSLFLNNYALKKNSRSLRAAAATGYFLSSAADAIDGALAREIVQNGGQHDTVKGQLVDVGADRAAETMAALARISAGAEKKQPLAIVAAAISGISNYLPSYARAYAESVGKPVAESGQNPLSFLGTRAGRLITTVVSNSGLEIKGQPIQPAVDVLATTANLLATKERIKVICNNSKNELPSLSEEQIAAAKTRKDMLAKVAVLGIGIIALHSAFSLKSIKQSKLS